MCLYCVLCCIFGLCMFKFYVCQCVLGSPVINAHSAPHSPLSTVLGGCVLAACRVECLATCATHDGNMRPAYKFLKYFTVLLRFVSIFFYGKTQAAGCTWGLIKFWQINVKDVSPLQGSGCLWPFCGVRSAVRKVSKKAVSVFWQHTVPHYDVNCEVNCETSATERKKERGRWVFYSLIIR